jgi:hypothetical protein
MILFVRSRGSVCRILLTASVVAAPLVSSTARAEEAFEGPKFRKG